MEWLAVMFAGPYNAAYAAAFATGGVLAIRAARRAGWPLLPWLALFAACAAGGIAGSKLFHFHLETGMAGEKTILGGILGGALAFLLIVRALGFPRAAADRLVPALAAGFALGRVGCFLAGCCFGKPTALPWGVAYAPGTDGYQQQIAAGLIGAGATATLPVHPTQLYEAAAALLIALAIWRLQGRLRHGGSAFLAFAAAFGGMRFLVEPLRADGAGSVGLTPVQWTLALGVPLLLVVLIRRERSEARRPTSTPTPRPGIALPAAVAAAVTALALLGTEWLTPLEQLTLLLLAAPPLVLAGAGWIRRRALAPAPGLAAMALVFQISPQPGLEPPEDSYLTLGAAAMTGRYEDTCGGVHEYRALGASLGYTRVTGPANSWGIHGQAFRGDEGRVTTSQAAVPPRDPLSGVGLRAQLDRRNFGLGAGIVAGRLSGGEYAETELIPSARLRAGSATGLHFDGRLADHEPAAFPAPVIQLGAGYGIGETGTAVRAGVSDAGFFGSGRLVTPGGLELEPFFGYGGPSIYHLSIAVRQRIGQGR